jgi:hypothetical protein
MSFSHLFLSDQRTRRQRGMIRLAPRNREESTVGGLNNAPQAIAPIQQDCSAICILWI